MLKYGNTIIKTAGGAWTNRSVDPYNPLNLPPFTIRTRWTAGTTPTISGVTGAVVTQVSADPNVWDITYENTVWLKLLRGQLKLLEVLGANTSGVTLMGSGSPSGGALFLDCNNLERVALFDTSSVTDMGYMFASSTSSRSNTKLTTIPLFDTSRVTNMTSMFNGCTALTTVPLLDTSNVTSMASMFNGCTALTTVPLLDTSGLTSPASTSAAYRMFRNCTSLTSVPLFNLSGTYSTREMFYGCTALTSVPLFDLSSSTNTYRMFFGCTAVESGALALYTQTSTQTTPPTTYSGMFTDCGRDTTTGAAELAQIPTSWGGTMS